MAKNTGLSQAKDAKKDEFYTAYEDIQAEMNHYEDKFKNKTVLCNCDDPFESNFCRFFLRNFNYLNLKRLICTSYITSPVIGQQLTIFDLLDEPAAKGNGYVMDIDHVPMRNNRGVTDADIDALLKSKKRGVKKLKEDGDFRSDECVEYLKQADIVVTNPPFSLFREYVAQLIAYKKEFLIIGNVNAITYKEIFPLIKDNAMWLGASIHSGDRKFYVPDDYPLNAAGCGIDKGGRKYIRVKGVRWFTNLDYARRHEELVLYKRYHGNEDQYPKYDNYDAINVDKVSDIPCDYYKDEVFVNNDKNNLTNIDKNGIIIQTTDNRQQTTDNRQQTTDARCITQDATALWACQSPSSTSITLNNSRLSEQPRARERDSRANCGMPTVELRNRSYMEREDIRDFSLRERCNGIMGVPITFLDKHNPEQFEIIGLAAGNIKGLAGIPPRTGKDGPYINGKLRYGRILIRRLI